MFSPENWSCNDVYYCLQVAKKEAITNKIKKANALLIFFFSRLRRGEEIINHFAFVKIFEFHVHEMDSWLKEAASVWVYCPQLNHPFLLP